MNLCILELSNFIKGIYLFFIEYWVGLNYATIDHITSLSLFNVLNCLMLFMFLNCPPTIYMLLEAPLLAGELL